VIGDKTPNMRLKDCEWFQHRMPAWKCPYTGVVELSSRWYCKSHSKEMMLFQPLAK
jgi:hypothetical protein